MRCTCIRQWPSGNRPADDTGEFTAVRDCPQHGQRTPSPTGTPDLGAGVPVVPLNQMVDGLREHAEESRRNAREVLEQAQQLASSLMREASYLDSIADTFVGRG